MTQSFRRARLVLLMAGAMTTLGACKRSGELVVDQGVGVTAVRSKCPAVGVPAYTGDITTFRGGQTTAAAMDVAATITNLRSTCNEEGAQIYSDVTFDVYARRSDVSGARSVDLPYFVTVLRGGNAVLSKRVGTVRVDFADGAERGEGRAAGAAYIDAAEATLPAEIRTKITRRRRAGDVDAALDPLADPDVKAAVARATFEVLIGFQLDERQLAYNATR